MKVLTLLVLVASCLNAQIIAQASFSGVVAAGRTVNLNTFGSVGHGGNDTTVIQTAINTTASGGYTLEIPVGASTYNVDPLTIPNNARWVVDSGAMIEATTGYTTFQCLFTATDTSNISITAYGSTFKMRKSEYTSDEFRHCFRLLGASNVTVRGMTCNDSGGDGLYIAGNTAPSSSNITIEDATFNNNRRQGFSLISGTDIFVRRSSFTNTNGTAPESGIDMEPNIPADRLINVHIEDSFSTGNNGDGITVALPNLDATSQPVSVTVLRHTSSSNLLSGYHGSHEVDGTIAGVTGTVLFDHCSSTLDGKYGAWAQFYSANGPALTFQNLVVTNANQSHTTVDQAAVAVERGGGGIGLQGNVYFLSPTITDNTSKIDYYYTIEDFSSVGDTRIQFLTPVALTGALVANGTTVWGLLEGVNHASLNIP